MKTTPLRIDNGKFMRGKEEVKPEFGNAEQIELLKQCQYLMESYAGDGEEIEIQVEEYTIYKASYEFSCVCGRSLSDEAQTDGNWSDDESDAIEELRKEISCSCGRRYEIKTDGSDAIVKFKQPNQ